VGLKNIMDACQFYKSYKGFLLLSFVCSLDTGLVEYISVYEFLNAFTTTLANKYLNSSVIVLA
jgi:hypothetical protein